MSTIAQQFTTEWAPILDPVAKKYGLNRDHLLAQIAQESYWGQRIPVGSNNFAGITEVRKGKGVTANDNGNRRRFRQFGSKEEFADYYGSLLARLYPGAVGAKTIEDFASALQDGKRRYAEAPNYKDALAKVYYDHYGNGQQPVTTTSAQGGTVATTQSMSPMAMMAYGQPFKVTTPKQEKVTDPFADVWKVEQAKLFDPGTEQIATYDTGYGRSDWVNKNWGIDPWRTKS